MNVRFAETWRPDGRLIHTGVYRIPEDMPEELALRAISEGVAFREPEPEQKPKAGKPAKDSR